MSQGPCKRVPQLFLRARHIAYTGPRKQAGKLACHNREGNDSFSTGAFPTASTGEYAGHGTDHTGHEQMFRGRAHLAVSILSFTGAILTGVTVAIVFRETGVFSSLVQLVNHIVLGLTVLLAFGRSLHKLGNWVLEWSFVAGTITWNFAMSVSLLGMLSASMQ